MIWYFVGPINCITKGITATYNRVAVRDVSSSNLASHYFAIKKSAKDVSLEEMFQAMYRRGFSEPELVRTSTMLKYSEILREDKTFLKIVERGTSKKDDHYVLLLPLGSPNLILPNNKKQVIQRLMGLKRRFIKNNKFFQDYLKFMDNLLGQIHHHQGR